MIKTGSTKDFPFNCRLILCWGGPWVCVTQSSESGVPHYLLHHGPWDSVVRDTLARQSLSTETARGHLAISIWRHKYLAEGFLCLQWVFLISYHVVSETEGSKGHSDTATQVILQRGPSDWRLLHSHTHLFNFKTWDREFLGYAANVLLYFNYILIYVF